MVGLTSPLCRAGGPSLREYIGDLELRRNIGKCDNIIIKYFSNIMAINSNVFITFMKDWNNSDLNRTSVIHMKRGGVCLRKAEFRQKTPEQADNIA